MAPADTETSDRRSGAPRRAAPSPTTYLRVLFALGWVVLQLGLVLASGRRADGAFGFRTFAESTTIRVALAREVEAGQRVPVEAGAWTARSADGSVHRYGWRDRIDGLPIDAELPTSRGATAELDRLQRALDDVIDHLDGELETRRLVAEVVVRRNGHEPARATLTSHARELR